MGDNVEDFTKVNEKIIPSSSFILQASRLLMEGNLVGLARLDPGKFILAVPKHLVLHGV